MSVVLRKQWEDYLRYCKIMYNVVFGILIAIIISICGLLILKHYFLSFIMLVEGIGYYWTCRRLNHKISYIQEKLREE